MKILIGAYGKSETYDFNFILSLGVHFVTASVKGDNLFAVRVPLPKCRLITDQMKFHNI